MNFLSHFYFNRFTDDTLLVAGCVLPDLVRNADPSIKIHPEKEQPEIYASAAPLWKGWQQHTAVDALFHNSGFFNKYSREIRIAVTPSLANSPIKGFFVAHIMLELLIDHLLIRQKAIQVNTFYRLLESADMSTIERFLLLSRKVSAEQLARFHQFYSAFCRNAYLHSYDKIEGICYALIQICKRIWPQHLSAEQEHRLCTVFENYAALLDNACTPLLLEIASQLEPPGKLTPSI